MKRKLSEIQDIATKEEIKQEAELQEEDKSACLICMEEFENDAPVFKTDCCKIRLHAVCWSNLEFTSGTHYTRTDYNRCPICRKHANLLTDKEAEDPEKSKRKILQGTSFGLAQEIAWRKQEKKLLLEEVNYLKSLLYKKEDEAAKQMLQTTGMRSEVIGVKQVKLKGRRVLKIGPLTFNCIPEDPDKQPSGKLYQCSIPGCTAKIETELSNKRLGQSRQFYLIEQHKHPE